MAYVPAHVLVSIGTVVIGNHTCHGGNLQGIADGAQARSCQSLQNSHLFYLDGGRQRGVERREVEEICIRTKLFSLSLAPASCPVKTSLSPSNSNVAGSLEYIHLFTHNSESLHYALFSFVPSLGFSLSPLDPSSFPSCFCCASTVSLVILHLCSEFIYTRHTYMYTHQKKNYVHLTLFPFLSVGFPYFLCEVVYDQCTAVKKQSTASYTSCVQVRSCCTESTYNAVISFQQPPVHAHNQTHRLKDAASTLSLC